MRRRPDDMRHYGYDSWDFGAQKGVYQPPLCVKWRGRWYRTLPRTAPAGEPSLDPADDERIRKFGRIPFGARACLDNLERRNKKFSDLPLFDAKKLIGR
jgi:hypothetical protein